MKIYTKITIILLPIFICNFLFFGPKKEEFKSTYKNGQLKIKYTYIIKAGKKLKEGKYTEYYTSGKIKLIKNYKNNKLNGKYKIFYSNGNPRFLIIYKNGKEIKSTHYYKDGKIKPPHPKELIGTWDCKSTTEIKPGDPFHFYGIYGGQIIFKFNNNGYGKMEMWDKRNKFKNSELHHLGPKIKGPIKWIVKYKGENSYIHVTASGKTQIFKYINISKANDTRLITDKGEFIKEEVTW